ncbi:MAG: ABC transporter permease subunit [Kiritimatiellia bacterium]
MNSQPWLAVRKELSPGRDRFLTLCSFLIPIGLWMLVSYVPFLWHPMMLISDPGDTYFQPEQYVEKAEFKQENRQKLEEGKRPAVGISSNPIYLPAPHQVAVAFYKAFTTPPRRPGQPWLHESLMQSIRVIILAFGLSSLLAVPLGILCGTFPFFRKLHEPFIEFFRYLPAPAFGALAVAVLGIAQAPKIAIVFIGTFFQQVLVISATTAKLDLSLLEAAQTLGASRKQLLTRVVVPGILPSLHRDQRILLGWAWTYLIVAEVVGISSGITWFINQQAKYRIFENVYAAIIMIGFLGLASDMILAGFGKILFPWMGEKPGWFFGGLQKIWNGMRARPARRLEG